MAFEHCESPEDNPGYAVCAPESLCEICSLNARITTLEAEVERLSRAGKQLDRMLDAVIDVARDEIKIRLNAEATRVGEPK